MLSNLSEDNFSFKRILLNVQINNRPTYYTYQNFSVTAGVSSGHLPAQYWFDFGGKIFMNNTGHLRGIKYKAYTGDIMIQSVYEHTVNGSALYYKGLRTGLMKALKLHFWSGIGWSRRSHDNFHYNDRIIFPLSTAEDIYYEAGFGISDYLNIFRADFIYNNIEKSVFIGLNFLM